MQEYKIIITTLAKNDIEKIRWYIKDIIKEPKIAQKMIAKIKESIQKLSKFPNAYSKPEFLREYNIRRVVVENYIIIYLIDEIKKENIILRIIYGKLDIDKLELYEENKKYI